jgi:hypothetical protein
MALSHSWSRRRRPLWRIYSHDQDSSSGRVAGWRHGLSGHPRVSDGAYWRNSLSRGFLLTAFILVNLRISFSGSCGPEGDPSRKLTPAGLDRPSVLLYFFLLPVILMVRHQPGPVISRVFPSRESAHRLRPEVWAARDGACLRQSGGTDASLLSRKRATLERLSRHPKRLKRQFRAGSRTKRTQAIPDGPSCDAEAMRNEPTRPSVRRRRTPPGAREPKRTRAGTTTWPRSSMVWVRSAPRAGPPGKAAAVPSRNQTNPRRTAGTTVCDSCSASCILDPSWASAPWLGGSLLGSRRWGDPISRPTAPRVGPTV